MNTKDWILLLVPLAGNLLVDGCLIFILNKVFENRQRVHSIKIEYATILREKIDKALMEHATATRLANEDNDENGAKIGQALTNFVDNSLEVYYYYIQNTSTLKKLQKTMEEFGKSIKATTDYYNRKQVADRHFSFLINSIRDYLVKLKDLSIKL